jgi:hypothetical protein
MGEIVDFKTASLIDNDTFVSDMARYAEGSLTEKQIRKKYRFDDATWEKMADDEILCEAIEAEKIRRIRDGSAKRELAQKHIVRGPDVLNTIMLDAGASPRHRVDAIKTLDAIATPPAQAAPADRDRFIIQINLGTDADGKEIVQRFNKSIAPLKPNEIDPNDLDSAPQDVIAAIAAKKKDDSSGEPV